VAAIRQDLCRRKSNWLRQAAEIMVEATLKDWKDGESECEANIATDEG
jgi:hypothetical protein